MALIVLQHTVADQYPVSATDIQAGMLVGLDANGFAVKAVNNTTALAVGVAGDTTLAPTADSGYSVDLVIGHPSVSVTDGMQAWSAPKRYTSNRVSDFYNETTASGMLTVYSGSGVFATNQYAVTTYTPGANLMSDTAGLFTPGNTGRIVGWVKKAPTAYPSGVPGTDVEGSMTLGDFLTFTLSL